MTLSIMSSQYGSGPTDHASACRLPYMFLAGVARVPHRPLSYVLEYIACDR